VILRDLVGPDETAVLVMPIDKEAPKGRIKQLQAQSIRDLLDGEACCVVVKDAGLQKALDNLKIPPGSLSPTRRSSSRWRALLRIPFRSQRFRFSCRG